MTSSEVWDEETAALLPGLAGSILVTTAPIVDMASAAVLLEHIGGPTVLPLAVGVGAVGILSKYRLHPGLGDDGAAR